MRRGGEVKGRERAACDLEARFRKPQEAKIEAMGRLGRDRVIRAILDASFGPSRLTMDIAVHPLLMRSLPDASFCPKDG